MSWPEHERVMTLKSNLAFVLLNTILQRCMLCYIRWKCRDSSTSTCCFRRFPYSSVSRQGHKSLVSLIATTQAVKSKCDWGGDRDGGGRVLGSAVKAVEKARQRDTGWRLSRVRYLPEDLGTIFGDCGTAVALYNFCTGTDCTYVASRQQLRPFKVLYRICYERASAASERVLTYIH